MDYNKIKVFRCCLECTKAVVFTRPTVRTFQSFAFNYKQPQSTSAYHNLFHLPCEMAIKCRRTQVDYTYAEKQRFEAFKCSLHVNGL